MTCRPPRGFAWLAFGRSGRYLLYVGATLLTYATVVIAIGLLRSL